MIVGLALVGLVVGVLLAAVPAAAPPPISMRTQGQAFDRSGTPLPMGTPIRTFVDGVNYSNGPSIQGGVGTYSVLTAGNSKTNANVSDSPTIQEGADLGDAVIYAAGDFTMATDVFQQVVAWSPGTVVNTALNVGSNGTTPAPLKIQGIVTQPARGGNQFVFLCNPTASSFSLADYYLELDAPGTYHGSNLSLSGTIGPVTIVRQDLPTSTWLDPTGDAMKLVYRNPGGASASAGGRDVVVDRIEFNATSRGSLDWEPGNTIMGDAPAPGPGRILERDANCTDTNQPADFSVNVEPGVSPTSNVTVAITSPTAGQSIPSVTAVSFSWMLSDDVFVPGYVHVWANVTIGTQTISLLSDQPGATSTSWTTPNVMAPAVLVVEAVDPFDARASTTRSFTLTQETPIPVIVAALIVVVIAAFLVLAFLRRRKKRPIPPPTLPPSPPPSAQGPPSGAPAPLSAQGLVAGKKVCPRCHTPVEAADATCFFCGYKFPEERPRA